MQRMKKYYEPDRVKREVPFEPIPNEVRAIYLRAGELLAIQERFPVAYQPLGTIEWHGRHLPIGCDSIKAERLCVEAASIAGGVVMPTIHFAADAHWDNGYGIGFGMDAAAGFQLPGSFYQVDVHLLKKWLINACTNYLNRGFKLVILVSGHNPTIQQNVMDEVCYALKTPDGKEPVCAAMDYTLVEPGDPRRSSDHAGGCETSMMLYLNGERVNMRANDGMARRELAIGGSFAFDQATAEEGEIRFKLQTAGLVKLAQEKLKALG
jgi:creatinine amidohydrolase